MRLCKIRILIALFAVVATADATPREDEIRELYRRALTGDKAAVEPCIANLEEALKSQPANQLARVTLGSALTLRSRDMGFGPSKLRTLNDGIAMMTSAVEAAAENAHVRLIRALTIDALPAILGKKRIAREDFQRLLEIAAMDRDALSPGELQTLYFNSAISHSDNPILCREQMALAAKYPVDPQLAARVNAKFAH